MNRRLAVCLVGLLALACIATGCGPTDGPRLTVVNRTDTPVGVYVDGDWIGTDGPGATIVATLAPTDADSYRIEARAPSGAVLATLDAPRVAVEESRDGGPAFGEIIAVPCGEIEMLVGELRPDEALAPAEAVTRGPCP